MAKSIFYSDKQVNLLYNMNEHPYILPCFFANYMSESILSVMIAEGLSCPLMLLFHALFERKFVHAV